jgi:ribulose-5-phosphate 4-epimerase/fuculose-1-phosphate aldolase
VAGDPELLVRPTPPIIEDPSEDRRVRKEALAAACRIFARLGLENGTAGHAAVRDPEDRDAFWTNPFGRPLSRMKAGDLILIDREGRLVDGHGRVNRAAFVIHSRIHEARPDVNASIHLHGTAGMAWSSLGRLLDPIVQDSCAFFEDHALFTEFNGAVLDVDECDKMAKVLGPAKAMILQNHGLLTVGETIDAAAWWMIRLDRCCQVQLLAEAAGDPHLIDEEIARATAKVVGTPGAGWFSFQVLLEGIREEEPEVSV